MSSLLAKSRSSLQKIHGWDVPLTCPKCGSTGQPRYEGWSPNLTVKTLGATVHAKVSCPRCGYRLTEEAGRKLLGLFQDIDLSARNSTIIGRFIASLILVPAALAFVLFFGMQMDWWNWGLGTIWVLLASAVSIPLLVVMKNRQIAGLPFTCECGNPHYICMGSLEDACCYRCYACGRLLKVRE